MAIIQSEWAAGRKQAPAAGTARNVVVERYSFTLTDDVAGSDILELAILPAFHFIVGATLVPEGDFDGATADIGIMSGAVGSRDSTRTSGDEVFDGAALTGVIVSDKEDALLLKPTDVGRSIGVKFSKSVTAADQKLTLILLTAQ